MKIMKISVSLLALLALGLLSWLYWQHRPSYIPEKLWGVWKTDHDRYRDRHLDISEAIFTIGQGREKIQVFFVQRVDRAPVGGRERVTLYYLAPDEPVAPLQTFSFYYSRQDGKNCIQLTHQEDILWYRESADARIGDPAAEGPAA
jgi:hypothetical protein